MLNKKRILIWSSKKDSHVGGTIKSTTDMNRHCCLSLCLWVFMKERAVIKSRCVAHQSKTNADPRPATSLHHFLKYLLLFVRIHCVSGIWPWQGSLSLRPSGLRGLRWGRPHGVTSESQRQTTRVTQCCHVKIVSESPKVWCVEEAWCDFRLQPLVSPRSSTGFVVAELKVFKDVPLFVQLVQSKQIDLTRRVDD